MIFNVKLLTIGIEYVILNMVLCNYFKAYTGFAANSMKTAKVMRFSAKVM